MDKTILTPEESLSLISKTIEEVNRKTIEETKKGFKDGSVIFLLWGFLMFFVTLCQFFIIYLEINIATGIPALAYPVLGGTFTFIYSWKKTKNNSLPKNNLLSNLLLAMGTLFGVNIMIMGVFFGPQLGVAFIPMILILYAFFIIMTGVSIKFKPILIGGIAINLLAFIPFLIDWQYHFLIMTLASVVGVIIPGILLKKS